MKRFIKIVGASILSLSVLCSAANAETVLGDAQSIERCMEDEPCWDCNTMGNKICGPSIQALADASWEGLSMEDQNFLNSIGASDETIIAYRDAQLAAAGLEGSWGIEVDPTTQEVLLVPVSPEAPHFGAELPHTL